MPTTSRDLASFTRPALCAATCAILCACGGAGTDDGAPARGVPEDGASALGEQGTYGCWSASFGSASNAAYGAGIVDTTGDAMLDTAIGQEIASVAQFFHGYPADVYLFDEGGPQYMNAYSTPQGFIMLGEYIMVDVAQFAPQDPLLPVAGVLSHEWGHQVQFRNGWQSQAQSTALAMELEADYFSGYYMAWRSYGGAEIQSYITAVSSLGNYDFSNPGFHGTPQMRAAMTAAGFNLAEYCVQQGASCNEYTVHQQAIYAEAQLGISYPAALAGQRSQAEAIGSRMDWPWIEGIATGRRSLAERPAIALPHRE